jgi:hypothetical protein
MWLVDTTHYYTTCYLPPTTYFSLLTSHCLRLTAYYLLPTTHHPPPTTHHPLPTTHHPPPTTHYGSASLEQRKKLLEELKVHPFNYAAMQAIQADFCKVRVVVSCQVTPCFSSLTPSVVNTC